MRGKIENFKGALGLRRIFARFQFLIWKKSQELVSREIKTEHN